MLANAPKTALFAVLLLAAATPALLMAVSRVLRWRPDRPIPVIDPFSPWVGIPLLFAALYGLGSLELSSWESPIDGSQFRLYFAGLAGYFGGLAVTSLGRRDRVPETGHRFSRLEGPALLGLFGATAAIAVVVLSRAGNPLLAADIETARTQVVVQVGGWMYYLYRTQSVALLLLLAAACRVSRPAERSLLLCLVAVSIVLVFSSGYRSHLVIPLAAFMVFRHYYVRPFSPVTVGAAVGLLVSFLILFGAIRYAGVGGAAEDVTRRLYVEIQNPAFALQRVTEYFPDVFPHFNGIYMLRGFAALLPGEQVAIGLILKEMLQLHFAGGGFAPSILGGFFIDFGMSGVVGGMFACGLLMGWSFRSMQRRPTFYRVLIYAYLTVYLAFSIRGGFLQEVFPLWFLFILMGLRWFFEPTRPVRRLPTTSPAA